LLNLSFSFYFLGSNSMASGSASVCLFCSCHTCLHSVGYTAVIVICVMNYRLFVCTYSPNRFIVFFKFCFSDCADSEIFSCGCWVNI
jgi:hypothetical protein